MNTDKQRFELSIDGRPATKGSLKWWGKGKVVNANDRTKTWEQWVEWVFLQKYGRPVLMTGAVKVFAVFYFKRPKSHFRTNGELNKKGFQYPYPSQKKNDIDKLLRTVFDALTSHAYKDDGQICAVAMSKEWDSIEGLKITIEAM